MLLTDQAALLTAQLNAARTLNARFAAAVELAHALGGGWPQEGALSTHQAKEAWPAKQD